MTIAWILLVPIGIFVARFFKNKLGVWWFRIHITVMGLAAILTIAGFVLVFEAVGTDHFSGTRYVSSSGYVGWTHVVFILYDFRLSGYLFLY